MMKLRAFQTYIKIYLTNSFIWHSKFFAIALNLFVRKLDSSIYLYINYQTLNNFTIKNWYILLLVGKLLNLFSYAKYFIKFNLINT